ncbi:hypothetical protein CFN78_00110 [Amycolatopsis antarctica]|uniref:SseB protein N-terminal domain-containing protein n=1 Tax=Amycolatopsis antarctica TaxID=1854586 RepID=A0A263D8H8_9PSEU|nr:SAV_915 family protein [Amycolatopsis antarctica]OZM74691.1 hypothetical protein CFN78_00110 [Amycolatopsis antarctica]
MVTTASLRAFDAGATELAGELAERDVVSLSVTTLPDGRMEALPSGRGELIVFAYTDAENVVTACGPGQPWDVVGIAELVRTADQSSPPMVFAVDMWHPAGARYPRPDIRDQEPLPSEPEAEPITEVWILALLPVAGGAGVELFSVEPGEAVLLGYRSLADMRACCGPHQAAVQVRPEDVDAVIAEAGADGLLFDVRLGEGVRREHTVVDWTRHDLFDPPRPPGFAIEEETG